MTARRAGRRLAVRCLRQSTAPRIHRMRIGRQILGVDARFAGLDRTSVAVASVFGKETIPTPWPPAGIVFARSLALGVALLVCVACAAIRGPSATVDAPVAIGSDAAGLAVPSQIVPYDRDSRNNWIELTLIHIDSAYYEFERELQVNRTSASTAAAMANLLFDIASSLTPSAGVKANYAAASALTSGSLAILNKETFLEQSVSSLVAAMRANRAKAFAPIRIGMTKSEAEYRLSDAHAHLLEYQQAGTLIEGMTFVAATTKEKAEKSIDSAEKEIQTAIALNAGERDTLFCISKSLEALESSRTDDLRNAYYALNLNPPAGDLKALVDALSASTTNAPPSRIREVYTTLERANLLLSPCPDY